MNLKNIVLMAVLLLFVSSVSVMAENECNNVLLEGETDNFVTSEGTGYQITANDFVSQDYAGGVHSADFVVNGEKFTLLEGEEYTLADNGKITLKELYYQTFAGGIHRVTFCLDSEKVEVDISGEPVQFDVTVNDYPDHQDYGLSKNIQFAYVNMYTVELEGDAFKVVDVEIRGTTKDAVVTLTIQPGEMVYFEGFKTLESAKEGAKAKKALLWTAPPYKNFGTNDGKLYQTNWLEIDEFLKNNQDYAAANSLSTPYQDVGQDTTEPTFFVEDEIVEPTFKLKVKSAVKGVKLDWKDISGFGETFDKYNVVYNKGKQIVIPANSYVDFSYYNLVNLNPGDYWTFMVCPTQDKVIVGDCSNVVTVMVQGTTEIVKIEDVKDTTAKYSIWTYSHGETSRADVGKYIVDPKNNYRGKLVEVRPAKLIEDFEGNKFYEARFDVKENEIVTFISFKIGLELPKVIDNVKTYPGYHNVLENVGFKDQWMNQALCKFEKKCTGGITGEGQNILYTLNVHDVDTTVVPGPIKLPEHLINPEVGPEHEPQTICPSGCDYQNKCVPVGTKIKENGDSLFCNWNGEMDNQLTVGEVCQNDYECGSNSCMSGKCLDLEKKLEEQQNLLNRILHWLENFFN
jgi:hypothetical protein